MGSRSTGICIESAGGHRIIRQDDCHCAFMALFLSHDICIGGDVRYGVEFSGCFVYHHHR